jgi:hypothetical protein
VAEKGRMIRPGPLAVIDNTLCRRCCFPATFLVKIAFPMRAVSHTPMLILVKAGMTAM